MNDLFEDDLLRSTVIGPTVDHDYEGESIRRKYRSVLGMTRFGPIPKYYGQPVVIGAFSIITQNVEVMKCVARHS